MKISFTPVGVVRNNIKTRHEMSGDGVASSIHIKEKYRAALYRVGQEKYLWVLCYLHLAKKNVLIAKPRKSKSIKKITRGVFSIHSPDRPNPISLTKVKLVRRRGLILDVDGLDVIDGTPVLDIKSYS